jgi:MoaA/NifB/PqqE/SkfB family radical SAM enzyme
MSTTKSPKAPPPSSSLPLFPVEPRALSIALPARPPTRTRCDGDPFSPHKILNHFDRVQAVASGQTAAPITVEIDPSNRCNHRCAWCVSMEAHTGELLDFDVFVRLIGDIKTMGVRSVVLKGGGEPTVHRRIDAMLRTVAEHGLALGLITNGSLPGPDTCATILETADWVRISLDAAQSETHAAIHGSRDFQRILRSIVYLTENRQKTQVGLNFVVEPRNHEEVLPFAKLGKTLGVDYVSIRCVFDPTRPLTPEIRAALRAQAGEARALQDEHFRVFLGDFTEDALNATASQVFPYRRCLAPNLIGVVGGEGAVYACCFLRGNPAFSFGNLAELSWPEIWAGERRRDVMDAIYRGECGHICIGGMTRSRYKLYNEILNYLALPEKEHADFI